MIVKSKKTSCRGCKLNNNGYCHWFEYPKLIPHDILNKGCKHRVPAQEEINTTEIVGYIMERFDGEIIDG